jgi:TRAP transporter TAXI family solute receptor
MKIIQSTCAALAAAMVAGVTHAQTIGIGTTKGGATAQVTAAISKIVNTKSDLKMRPQPMGGTQQYIPLVNVGEIDFGVSNLPQYWMAKTGTGMSKRRYDNLVLVATMMTFKPGTLVTKNSRFRKMSDLRGARIAHGFKAAPLFQFVTRSWLANGNLGWDDVNKVPAVALRQHWTMFKQGKIDMVIAAIGSAIVKDMNANISGGVRFIPLDSDPAAFARLDAIYPKGFLREVKPSPKFTGVLEPLQILHFDYMFWTHKGQKDETVYKVAKAVYDNEKGLHDTSPLWRSHHSRTMAKDQGTPYHPGAIKFFKEVGIWKR